MDKSLFTAKALGSLNAISVEGENDWAFIPAPLPDHWDIPSRIWPLLLTAREELARLDGVGRHMPDYELLMRPLREREALRSSSLEGTYATPKQLLLYQMNPKEPRSRRDPVNSWKEVANYSSALRLGQELLEELPISLRFIRELHRELLHGVRGHQRNPGNFRRSQVHVGSERRFIPPPPTELDRSLDSFEKYIHAENSIDPLIFCFMVHYQFEAIHPFLDGNGRVGRLLLSLMIYKWCGLTKPWLYLSEFFDKYKDEYIKYLFEVGAKGDWNNWISYCLRGTIQQATNAVKRLDDLLALREKYQQSVINAGASVRLHKTLDSLFEFPVITVPSLVGLNQITYPTAKADIDKLIRIGVLSVLDGNSRPKVFYAPEIFRQAYSDLESEPDETG